MIPEELKRLFNLSGNGEPLEGGQGLSYKFENVVIKPVWDRGLYEFISPIYNSLDCNGYRISRHLKSLNNNFVESGYGATSFEPGFHVKSELKKKLYISGLFHKDLRKIRIDNFPKPGNPWNLANEIIWKHEKIPEDVNKLYKFYCEKIIEQLPEVKDDFQLIHADIGGNILFHESLDPLIIDFSPVIGPVKYANAIMICDAIAWDSEKMKSIYFLSPLTEYIPYIKYAVAFRIITALLHKDFEDSRFLSEYEAYMKIWNFIIKSSEN